LNLLPRFLPLGILRDFRSTKSDPPGVGGIGQSLYGQVWPFRGGRKAVFQGAGPSRNSAIQYCAFLHFNSFFLESKYASMAGESILRRVRQFSRIASGASLAAVP
jgi:hypothetical protein